MTGCNVGAPERLGLVPEIPELQLLVAHDARVRCSPSLVFTREIRDDGFFELVSLVHHVMWKAKGMSNGARVGHGLWPATFVFRARDAVLWPHLHGHTDDLVALLAQKIPSDAGVHSTAHP